jgi:hypothetical protein
MPLRGRHVDRGMLELQPWNGKSIGDVLLVADIQGMGLVDGYSKNVGLDCLCSIVLGLKGSLVVRLQCTQTKF